MALDDQRLEKKILAQLSRLERLVDCIGPTPLRHRMSFKLVEMRREIMAFDQAAYEHRLSK